MPVCEDRHIFFSFRKHFFFYNKSSTFAADEDS